MITVGLILVALALFLPPLGVVVAAGLLHAALVLGVILVVVGLVLYLGARSGAPWGRRYW